MTSIENGHNLAISRLPVIRALLLTRVGRNRRTLALMTEYQVDDTNHEQQSYEGSLPFRLWIQQQQSPAS